MIKCNKPGYPDIPCYSSNSVLQFFNIIVRCTTAPSITPYFPTSSSSSITIPLKINLCFDGEIECFLSIFFLTCFTVSDDRTYIFQVKLMLRIVIVQDYEGEEEEIDSIKWSYRGSKFSSYSDWWSDKIEPLYDKMMLFGDTRFSYAI